MIEASSDRPGAAANGTPPAGSIPAASAAAVVPPTATAAEHAAARLHLAVAIATTGRRDTLRLTVPRLAHQTRLPDRVVLSVAQEDDVDRASLAALPFAVDVRVGPKGLCRQRNTALAALADCDVVVFLDDDFLMREDYLAAAEQLFRSRPDVAVATGTVVADGIGGPGLSFEAGLAALADDRSPPPDGAALVPTYGAYGCNMALRLAPMRAHAIAFDERLPLYGWLEDIDASRRLAAHGTVVRSRALRGVHLGEKRGRSSGLKLGYAQVANPVYLVGKGSLSGRFAYRYLVRNLLKNALMTLRPEPWVDRRGRLRGNLLALRDLVTGRLSPERMLDVGP